MSTKVMQELPEDEGKLPIDVIRRQRNLAIKRNALARRVLAGDLDMYVSDIHALLRSIDAARDGQRAALLPRTVGPDEDALVVQLQAARETIDAVCAELGVRDADALVSTVRALKLNTRR